MNVLNKSRCALFLVMILINLVRSEDLIIASGDTVELSGTHFYDIVIITNSSTLSVDPDSGALKITCDSLHIGGTSKLNANGVSLDSIYGGQPYQSLAGGGAGAGFAGPGGDGGGSEISFGGDGYGSTFSFLKGSKGGTGHSIYDGISDGNHAGGNGGGAIWLEARVSNIFGEISANGEDGIQYDSYGSWPSGDDWGGSGGGSGGQIYIKSPIINFGDLTLISAKGGAGGVPLQGTNEDNTNPGGGGGGSGGRITIINEQNINPDHFIFSRGLGGTSSDPDSFDGLDGAQGILNHIKIWLFSDTHPNKTLHYLNNKPEFKLINRDDYIGYFYELDTLENTQVDLSSDYIVSDGEETIFSPGKLEDGIYYLHAVPYDGGEASLDSLALTKQIRIGTNSIHINSSTHSNSNEWYQGQNIAISLDYPFGVTKFYYEFDESPFTIPVPDSSLLAENSSWIMPGLEDGIYFMHIIPQDSLGFNLYEPIRKRFNVGETYPFTAFSQNNMDSDTLIFSYQTINTPIQFSWNPTSLVEGQWYYYDIDFYHDLDSVFSTDIISGDSLSINYNALDVYQYMSQINQDTLSGHWWIKTFNPYGDTLMSSNGPMPFTIVRDTNLTTYSNFSMNSPAQNSALVINQETLNDTILFAWDPCENIYGDTIVYHIHYESSFGNLIRDSLVIEPMLKQPLVDIYLGMLDSNMTSVQGEWIVTAINGLDTIESITEPFNLSIEIDSDEIIPLAPFVLRSPEDSTFLYIDADNLLDTLVLDWGSSFNINGLETSYSLSYEIESELINSNTIFQDTMITDSEISFDNIQIFNSMDAAGIDTLSFIWQVNISDNTNELNSLNGPFKFTIYRQDMDIEKPIIAMNINQNLITYSSIIDFSSTYIYNDTLSYFIDYSIDGGTQWFNQFYTDTLINKLSMTYDWNVFETLGWDYIEDVHIRFYANNGNVFSDTVLIDSLTIANIAGDYIYEPESELGIQANDIAQLLSLFYQEGDSLGYYDIGPSSGIAPNILSDPDKIINFEDLSTFTQMWYWSTKLFAPITEIEMTNANSIQNSNIIIEKNLEGSNEISSNYSIKYYSQEKQRGFDLVLRYDPKYLNIINIDLGQIIDDRYFALVNHSESDGIFTASIWTKNNTSILMKGNLINLRLEKIDNDLNDQNLDLFIEPHIALGQKESILNYSIEIPKDEVTPKAFSLDQNFPNPFNPTTQINYEISKLGSVELIIYDLLGNQVLKLVNRIQTPGQKSVQWNGKDKLGINVGTGIYFYTLNLGNQSKTKKMIYMK